MLGRNERKAAVLGVLLREGSVTTKSLVERWGLSHGGAQASLERYRRHSLLTRQREQGPGPPVYRYRLTTTGRRKAAWFAGQALSEARKRPKRLTRQSKTVTLRRLLKPQIVRRVARPQIHRQALLEQQEWVESEEEATTRVIRPKVHRRRRIRPHIHQEGDFENDQSIDG